MIQPFMSPGLILFPRSPSLGSLVLLLFAGIAETRQGYVGRIGIAANAFLLWQIFYSSWSNLPAWFQVYLDLGTILAIIAIPSYLLRESLPSEFYGLAYTLYGSLSVIFAVALAVASGIPIT